MLILTVPLRYLLRTRGVTLGDRGLVLGSAGYGAAVGGTVGAGVILLSILMATGLMGAAVIATDAVISIAVGVSRLMVFGAAGATLKATSPPAASRTGSIPRCRRCAARKSCRDRTAD